ncbi:MAG: hypothetical protein AB7F32_11560 [Victivallaceae bacterium]
MSRKDYISDNLVNIRDRLRQSTGTAEEPAAPEEAATVGSESVPTPSLAEPAPAAEAVVRREADGDRAKRDLQCRLGHESAAVETELRLLEERIGELGKLKVLFAETARKLEETTPEKSGSLFAREVDMLRIEFFRLAGRREADTAPVPGKEMNSSALCGRELLLTGGMVAAAVLIGAVIIGGAIAVVFR